MKDAMVNHQFLYSVKIDAPTEQEVLILGDEGTHLEGSLVVTKN